MSQEGRIQLSKNRFAKLISEVDSSCPLCQENLIDSVMVKQQIFPRWPISIPTVLLTQKKNCSKMFQNFLMILRVSKI